MTIKEKKLLELRNRIVNYIKKIKTNFPNDDKEFKKTVNHIWDFFEKNSNIKGEFFNVWKDFENDTNFFDFKRILSAANMHSERIGEIEDIEKYILKNDDEDIKFNSKHFKKSIRTFNRETLKTAIKETEHLSQLTELKKDSVYVMVGCGPLPLSALSFAHSNPEIKCIGIDFSPEAIFYAKKVKNFFSIPNIKFALLDGLDFDYKSADYVLIANLVKNKKGILDKIYKTNNKDVSILLRCPYTFSKLFYEDIDYREIEYFENCGELQMPYEIEKTLFLRPKNLNN